MMEIITLVCLWVVIPYLLFVLHLQIIYGDRYVPRTSTMQSVVRPIEAAAG